MSDYLIRRTGPVPGGSTHEFFGEADGMRRWFKESARGHHFKTTAGARGAIRACKLRAAGVVPADDPHGFCIPRGADDE